KLPLAPVIYLFPPNHSLVQAVLDSEEVRVGDGEMGGWGDGGMGGWGDEFFPYAPCPMPNFIKSAND
ncbi:hypothetical protein VF05_30535, partial [Nostoc linckia z3]